MRNCHITKLTAMPSRGSVFQTNQPHITKYTNSKYPTALTTCGGGQSGRESFLLACLPDDWEQARTGFQMKSPTRSAPAFKLFSISAQNSRGVLTEIEIELMSVLSPFQWWLWITKVPQLWNKLYMVSLTAPSHMILLKEWKNRDFKRLKFWKSIKVDAKEFCFTSQL